MGLGNMEKAFSVIEEGRKRFPEDVNLMNSEVTLYLENNELDKAQALLDVMKTYDNSYEVQRAILMNEISIVSAQNDKEKIFEKLDRLIELEPEDTCDGLHKEQYIFDRENTTNVKSDFVLKSICISGQPRYCAEYRNGKVEEKEETMIEFKIVISDDEEREVIIKKLQKSLARIVYKESDLTSRFK